MNLQKIQIIASAVAVVRGGWTKSADAVALRGMAYFLRMHKSERLRDLATAKNMRVKRWQCADLLKKVVESLCKRARDNVPELSGNWIQLPSSGSGYAARFAPGTAQVGKRLYVFGGLCPKIKTYEGEDDSVGALHKEICRSLQQIHMFFSGNTDYNNACDAYNDLVCFDFETRTWSQIKVKKDRSGKLTHPPPRGFCSMAANESKGKLYVLGGSDSYDNSTENFLNTKDVRLWVFDLKTQVWTVTEFSYDNDEDAFRHNIMCNKILGSGLVEGNKWYFVLKMQKTDTLELHYIDLEDENNYRWVNCKVSGNAPAISASYETTSFFIEKKNTLYIWGREGGKFACIHTYIHKESVEYTWHHSHM
tara:strand:+ start:1 stop:1092 length:1092 start_codon:yes stop_codon:yes gene_type:complete